MIEKEWKYIETKLTPDEFSAWLDTRDSNERWCRKDGCCCPLHAFVESVTGVSLFVDSPEIHEHWAEEDESDKYMDTPWWMVWMLRAIDRSGEGDVSAAEVRSYFAIGRECNWDGGTINKLSNQKR